MLRVWLVPSVKRKGERRRGGERAQMHVVDGVVRAIAVPLFWLQFVVPFGYIHPFYRALVRLLLQPCP